MQVCGPRGPDPVRHGHDGGVPHGVCGAHRRDGGADAPAQVRSGSEVWSSSTAVQWVENVVYCSRKVR